MRALIVSTAHPSDPAIFDGWVAPLLRDGWDVVYAAPFTDYGVPPQEGLTGLDLPTNEGGTRARKVAAGMLRHRGPEADLVVVSSDRLALLTPPCVPVLVASDEHQREEITAGAGSASVTRRAADLAGPSATPSAT